jgi:hypothetical protein
MRPETSLVTDAKELRQITVRTGKLFLVSHGDFILLPCPIILKNGTIITTEGLMNMPNGTSRILREGEYV